MAKDKPTFIDGMIVRRHERAPSFLIASLSIKVDEFKNFMLKNQQGIWMNIDIKLSRNGKYYAELNTYNKGDALKEKQVREEEQNQSDLNNLDTSKKDDDTEIKYPEEEINIEDIPF